ncbi:GntT/GntP/DsdX family permease [Serratia nematodiphila]
MSTVTLVGTAVGSVLLLLFLVMKARMHAFVALMLVSIAAGIFSGMPLEHIADTMQKGMGDTLGFLAIVVALGAMFGKILHEVGALDQIAAQLLKRFGQSKAHYALGIAGLICALPLFFDVAVVLLIGIVFAVARRTDGNIVKLAIPLFAGVAAAASYLLPGPVPMLLASQMKADFGWMIAIGLVAAVIGMLIAGPLYGSFISRFVNWPMPPEENEPTLTKGNLPSFGFSLALGDAMIGAGLPIAVAAFALSAMVRVIQGSATVACLTTVGLVLPVTSQLGLSGGQLAALAICIAGGSIVLSHVNDAGFWLFGKFTGANELQTLKTWTVMETILGSVGGAIGMIAFTMF